LVGAGRHYRTTGASGTRRSVLQPPCAIARLAKPGASYGEATADERVSQRAMEAAVNRQRVDVSNGQEDVPATTAEPHTSARLSGAQVLEDAAGANPPLRAARTAEGSRPSAALERLYEQLPAEGLTLGQLSGDLQTRSFGLIVLLLSLVAIVPGVSILAGLLLLSAALQMAAGRATPVFSRRIASLRLPARYFAAAVRRAIPLLRRVEKVTQPRWKSLFGAGRRVVGAFVAILGAAVAFTPIPLSNVAPALTISLIAVAYLEEDGLMMACALVLAIAVIVGIAFGVWQVALAAEWVGVHG
jgi:hypothetical protein